MYAERDVSDEIPRHQAEELAGARSGCPLNAILWSLNFVLQVMGKHGWVIRIRGK